MLFLSLRIIRSGSPFQIITGNQLYTQDAMVSSLNAIMESQPWRTGKGLKALFRKESNILSPFFRVFFFKAHPSLQPLRRIISIFQKHNRLIQILQYLRNACPDMALFRHAACQEGNAVPDG